MKEVYQILNITLGKEEQENLTKEALVGDTHIVPVFKNSKSIPIEVESGKTLNINPSLSLDEHKRLISLLKETLGSGIYISYFKLRVGVPACNSTQEKW